jgi:antitoxin HigA-1
MANLSVRRSFPHEETAFAYAKPSFGPAWARLEEELFDLCWRSLATEKTQAAIVYFKTPGLDSRLGRVCKIPGEILSHEFMEPLGLSGNALALALRVPANRITAIVNGERAISADTALRLARYFGTTPEFWINMQAGHDLSKARAESGKQIAAEVRAHG